MIRLNYFGQVVKVADRYTRANPVRSELLRFT